MTAPDRVIIDDSDDLGLDDPYTQYAVEVTAPDGETRRLRCPRDGGRLLAERRAAIHRAAGASAVVMERTWTPTRWWPTRAVEEPTDA